MTEESDFKRLQPKITELTVAQAKQHYDQGEEILSLNGKGTAISNFILMLATGTEKFGPYLLNSASAHALHGLLEAEGFGSSNN